MIRVRVHVTPRSNSDDVVGWRGTELAVRVTAPPDGGKANAAVCALVAKRLGVAKSTVSVVRGHSARHKTIEIAGVDERGVKDAFGEPEAPLF